MEKRRYFVSLHSGFHTGEIREADNGATYDFAIEATPQEIAEVHALFRQAATEDFRSYAHVHVPYPPYTDTAMRRDNDAYDETMTQIYRKLHALGTEETKRHIEAMDILH